MTESFAGNGLEHLINDAANGKRPCTAWVSIRQVFFPNEEDSTARKLVTEMAAARGVWASFSTYPEGVFICFQVLPTR